MKQQVNVQDFTQGVVSQDVYNELVAFINDEKEFSELMTATQNNIEDIEDFYRSQMNVEDIPYTDEFINYFKTLLTISFLTHNVDGKTYEEINQK